MYEEVGEVVFESVRLADGNFEVRVTLQQSDAPIPHLKASSLKITSADDESSVSAVALRALRVHELVKDALTELSKARHPSRSSLYVNDPERLRAQGPTEETLLEVARVYLAALRLRQPPARQVEIAFGLPRTTASKWVRRARDLGFLSSLEKERRASSRDEGPSVVYVPPADPSDWPIWALGQKEQDDA